MTPLRGSLLLLLTLMLDKPTVAQNPVAREAEISNGILHVALYLPEPQQGFYRGTRFDWSGVIHSLKYNGHDYYGPWFTKTDPAVIDFIFEGEDIVAGPCSAIMGPVEEFSSNGSALGFNEAKPGGTFIKIGVGVLRRPDKEDYNPYRLYDIVDGGKWSVHKEDSSIDFIQELNDPASGYGYRYTKTIQLIKDKSEMVLEHALVNTGRRQIETSVYDHNFLVLDKQPTSADFVITVPFALKTEHIEGAEMARIEGHQFTYRKTLSGRETVAAEFSGFGSSGTDYNIAIENKKLRAGIKVTGNRPLSKEHLWSIRSVVSMEPFIDMSIGPGESFTWRYDYTYYSLNQMKR